MTRRCLLLVSASGEINLSESLTADTLKSGDKRCLPAKNAPILTQNSANVALKHPNHLSPKILSFDRL
jgi:hypothetical protein